MNLFRKMTATTAIVALASGLMVTGASAYTNADVENANYLANEGIIVNRAAEPAKYELNRNVLRQEIAAVARGIAKLPKTTTCTNQFTDVSATKPNTWACYTVEALRNAGMVAANPTFRPEANITKSEAIGMVVKACKGSAYEFDKSLPGNWQAQVVNYAAANGYTQNFTDYNALATRGFVFSAAANCYKTKGDVAIDPSDALCQLLGTCNGTDTGNNTGDNSGNVNVVGQDKAVITLAPQSPNNGAIATDSPRSPVLAFEVKAGNTDVTLQKANLKFIGLGEASVMKELAIYRDEVKVTRGSKPFNSRNEAGLSFDRDVVVKAGETATFVVTSKIEITNGIYNQNLKIALATLEASSPVEGSNIESANLIPTYVANKGKLKFSDSNATGRAYLGEQATLYNFSLREEERKEDVVVKSLTFEEGTGNDLDLAYLNNLELYADGKKVDANFTVQRSKIVATLDYTIGSGKRVNFILKGTAVDGLGKSLVLNMNEGVYAVGQKTGISTDVAGINNTTSITKEIVGTAVNFTFVENASKEVSFNATDAQMGTLNFVTTSEYNADIKIVLNANSGNTEENRKKAIKAINGLEIDGQSGTKVTGESDDTKLTYTFDDVLLKKGTNVLPLTLDINGTTDISNVRLAVSAQVTELVDDVLGEKVTKSNVLNNDSAISRTLTIKAPSLTLRALEVAKTKVVPTNSPKVVLYKGQLDVSNSENITIENLTFNNIALANIPAKYKDGVTDVQGVTDLQKVLGSVTLNIGGKTFNGVVNAGNIQFNSVFAEIQKGAKSVDVLISATLKDRQITKPEVLAIAYDTMALRAENTSDITPPAVQAEPKTAVELTTKGTIKIEQANQQIDDQVLAGSNAAKLATFKMKAEFEDLYVTKLVLNIDKDSGDNTNLSALSNIRLMEGTKEIANGGIPSGSTITFENFTIDYSSNLKDVSLVADLARYDDAGGTVTPFLGKFQLTSLDLTTDSTDLSANPNGENHVVSSEEVKVVPAIVTIAATDNKFGDRDAVAKVKVTVAKGDNNINTLTLDKLSMLKVGQAAFTGIDTVQLDNKAPVAYAQINTIDVTGLNSFDLTITLSEQANNVRLKNIELDSAAGKITSVDFNQDLGSYYE